MRKIICFHNPDEINGYLSNWYLSVFEVDGDTKEWQGQVLRHCPAILLPRRSEIVNGFYHIFILPYIYSICSNVSSTTKSHPGSVIVSPSLRDSFCIVSAVMRSLQSLPW